MLENLQHMQLKLFNKSNSKNSRSKGRFKLWKIVDKVTKVSKGSPQHNLEITESEAGHKSYQNKHVYHQKKDRKFMII